MKTFTLFILLTICSQISYSQLRRDIEKEWALYKNNKVKNEYINKLSDNSIILFNKEVQFGISSDEFKLIFDDFKLHSQDGNDVNYLYETQYADFFSNFWITAKFKDNKLVCLELNGWQTEEYMQLIDETLTQFQFDKTVEEESEDFGTVSSDFYHKDDLIAEYFNFETAFLSICFNM